MPIVQAGDPVLRRPASPVPTSDIGSEDILSLVEALQGALVEYPGVGVAAPQIGVGLRVVLIQDPADIQARVPPELLAELERTPIEPYVLVNPQLEPIGVETRTFFEGCLSVEGYRGLVPRAAAVRVRYLDLAGGAHDEVRSGWHARILQHEVDHLDGVLYVDRMLTRSFMTDAHYFAWGHRPTDEVCQTFGINRDSGVSL